MYSNRPVGHMGLTITPVAFKSVLATKPIPSNEDYASIQAQVMLVPVYFHKISATGCCLNISIDCFARLFQQATSFWWMQRLIIHVGMPEHHKHRLSKFILDEFMLKTTPGLFVLLW